MCSIQNVCSEREGTSQPQKTTLSTGSVEAEETKPLSKLEKKRKSYRCGNNYVTLNDIVTWPTYVEQNTYLFKKSGYFAKKSKIDVNTDVNDELNSKVSLWQGDITCLEIDAIVNAANNSLLGGGGVDGCIHRAAGRGLFAECQKLGGCDTGSAKITTGHKLPANHVIHTVGPRGENKEKLRSCYESCLSLVKEHQLRTVAFCCISTGIYGYPNKKAANVALEVIKKWLMENMSMVDRIIFCVFLQKDLDIYNKLMWKYFPCTLPGQLQSDDDDKHQSQGTDMDIDQPPKHLVAQRDKGPEPRGNISPVEVVGGDPTCVLKSTDKKEIHTTTGMVTSGSASLPIEDVTMETQSQETDFYDDMTTSGNQNACNTCPGDKMPGDTVAGDNVPGGKNVQDIVAGKKLENLGDTSSGESVTRDRCLGDTPFGNSTPGDKHPGDTSSGDKGPGDKHPGDTSSGDKGPGDKHPGDTSSGDKGPGDKHPGNTLSGDKGPGDKHPGNTSAAVSVRGGKSSGARSIWDRLESFEGTPV